MRTLPSRIIRWAGVGILLWFLVGYILYPVWTTLFASFTDNGLFTAQRYLGFFSSAASLTVLRNSIVLGALTVAACGLLGTGLAFLIHYFEFPYKNIVDKLLLLPLMMPGIIIVFAFVQLYGESGLATKTIEAVFRLKETPYEFSGLLGILFVHALTQYVYFYITVSLSLIHI